MRNLHLANPSLTKKVRKKEPLTSTRILKPLRVLNSTPKLSKRGVLSSRSIISPNPLLKS